MKIGGVLFVLIMALVGLGFLGSEHLQVRRQLQAAREQIAQLEAEREQLSSRLDRALQDVEILMNHVNDLEGRLKVACTTQANVSAQTTDNTPVGKIAWSASLLLLPTLAVGVPVTLRYFRGRRNYIRLTDAEIHQIIRLRRQHKG